MAGKGKVARFWNIFKQRKSALFGLAVIVIFVLGILAAPIIAPYDPSDKTGSAFEPPSRHHLLGTNDIGVDILSELIYAGRVSLMVGLIATGFIIIIGSSIGLISGYFGGFIDEILMRITDVVLILPRLPLMIVMAAYLGPGMWTIIFVYSIVGWASVARQVRSQVLPAREATFVEASRAIGAGNTHIIISHILPNISGIIIANGVMEIMFAILTEAGLSFLGLGDPTHKSWGVMLYFAQLQGAFLRGAWWWIFPPGICIALFSCAFNFVGTALNDLFGLKLGKRDR
ncbi:MAG: ABC transporter permease [Deltaproteobacteria bacterium]|nr:ABC transporter permease [Deltaproteobacteria bacterium]